MLAARKARPALVNITDTPRTNFAWRCAIDGVQEWWERLAEDPILGPRWHRVKRHPNGCWFLQMAPGNQAGHILLTVTGGLRVFAHRRAYEVVHGPIPRRKVVRHTCDDPACVNPAHLLVGTQKQNIQDAVQRGRWNAWGRRRLTPDSVRAIRKRFDGGEPQKSIAAAFGVSKGCIYAVVRRLTWLEVA